MPFPALDRVVTVIQVHHQGGPHELRTPEEVAAFAMARTDQHFSEDPYNIHIYRLADGGVLGVNRWTWAIGRDLNKAPAASPGHNAHGIAVVVHGDWSREPLPEYARDTLIEVLAWLCRGLGLAADAVFGHRELQPGHTECPGFDMEPIRDLLRSALRD